MKYMRFSYRVALSFFIILLISLSVSVLSIFYVRNIGGSLKKLYDHPLTVSNAVRDINIHINAIHRSMKDVALAENEDELRSAIEKVHLSDEAIHQSFAVVKERFLGNHKNLDTLYTVYMNWEPIRNEVIILKSSGNDNAATKITKGKGAQHVALLFQKTKELTDFAQGKADEFYLSTQKNVRYSYFSIGAGIAILLCFGSISIFLLSKSITEPINDFIRKIVKVMEREGTHDFNSSKMSEQAIFDKTLNELKFAYEKLQSYNEELDRRVEERTTELSAREAQLIKSNHQIKDLNERFKLQNADLEEAKLKAEESDRLKSAFLANMSHEIRTPMNAIIGFTELLDDEDVDKVSRVEYMGLIRSAGNQLLRLISDIVDLSKIDAEQMSINLAPCDIRSVLEGVYKRFELYTTKGGPQLSLNTEIMEGRWAQLDEQRITQVLSNLMENAFKHTEHGKINLCCRLIDDSILFSVKDTGVGISLENQEKIFKRFHQVEREDDKLREGTGLGLSICESLVRLMGGSICLESQPNIGSEFFVSIPLISSDGPRIETNIRSQNSTGTQGARILIVEDEHSNQTFLQALLKKNQFKTLSASNGLEAVDLLQKGERPDLILMDLKMPKMDGYEALKHVLQICPEVPVIAQTAYAMSNDQQKVLNAGFSEYLSKPISEQSLVGKINKLLSHRLSVESD